MKLLKDLLNIVCDLKAIDIVCFDFDKISPFYQYNIVCTATNERQLNAISEHLADYLRLNKLAYSVEGKNGRDWILVDAKDVLINIFSKDARIDYNLEKLYSYVPRIAVEKYLNV